MGKEEIFEAYFDECLSDQEVYQRSLELLVESYNEVALIRSRICDGLCTDEGNAANVITKFAYVYEIFSDARGRMTDEAEEAFLDMDKEIVCKANNVQVRKALAEAVSSFSFRQGFAAYEKNYSLLRRKNYE